MKGIAINFLCHCRPDLHHKQTHHGQTQQTQRKTLYYFAGLKRMLSD